MVFLEFFLTGVGLAMDAFAVSVCKGLGMTKVNRKQMLTFAAFFGGFQALMPFIGWLLGSRLEKYIERFDHWIAFGLLAFIGIKMIIEAVKGGEENGEETVKDQKLDLKELTVLAVATSIDALAVGITYGITPDHPIGVAVLIIGVTTALICIAGVYIGNIFGHKYEKRATIVGGSILVLIGLKILIEGLGIVSFAF